MAFSNDEDIRGYGDFKGHQRREHRRRRHRHHRRGEDDIPQPASPQQPSDERTHYEVLGLAQDVDQAT